MRVRVPPSVPDGTEPTPLPFDLRDVIRFRRQGLIPGKVRECEAHIAPLMAEKAEAWVLR